MFFDICVLVMVYYIKLLDICHQYLCGRRMINYDRVKIGNDDDTPETPYIDYQLDYYTLSYIADMQLFQILWLIGLEIFYLALLFLMYIFTFLEFLCDEEEKIMDNNYYDITNENYAEENMETSTGWDIEIDVFGNMQLDIDENIEVEMEPSIEINVIEYNEINLEEYTRLDAGWIMEINNIEDLEIETDENIED